MSPRKCSHKVRPRVASAVVHRSLLGCVLAAFGCVPAEGVSFSDAAVPGSGGMTASSGGAPGSGGAAPGTGGAAPGTGGRGTGGATGSGGAASGGSGAGTGGRGTGGSGSGTGGAGTAGRGTGGSGSGTGGSGAGGTAVTFSQVATIFGTSCGTGTCHTGTDHVDLRNTAGWRDRVVGKMPAGARTMASCKTMTLVVAGNTASSIISQIIKAQVGACGARMPDECSTSSSNPRACLTTAQTATIDNWITGGALP